MSGEATVWWAELDDFAPDSFADVLCADERRRAASFRFPRDRARFVAARGLLRTLLADHLGTDPKRIEFAYGERGKPRLAADEMDLRFNLSHSAGFVALAFCEGREVGVDIEAVREDLITAGIARRYLFAEAAMEIERRVGAERTEEFFRAWVRQEAYAKGHGAGLELIGQSLESEGWTMLDLDLIDGYAAALAVEGGGGLDGGEQLVADPARVGHAGGERLQVLDVRAVGTAEPVR
ncbi:MAG: 4-phosphopantetheinyl transferase [Solirubrobacterales bacterium]|nr:4-phosphopantetheinyl transferase [Solirubrobacterales bacterium]